MWESYSAFANTLGGSIILGVKQVKEKFEIVGVLEKQGNPQLNNVVLLNEEVFEDVLDIEKQKGDTSKIKLPQLN